VADGRRTGAPKLVVGVSVAATVAALAVLALLVHLVSGGGGPAPAAPLSFPPPSSWERTDLHAVTQPVPAQDRLLVYVGQSGKLRLVSLYSGSGATAWARNAVSSYIAPGEPPVVTIVGGTVVYLEPVAVPGAARLVAAAVSDGRIAWRSDPGFFSGWPHVCPDDPHAVCLSGGTQQSGDAAALSFDASTGEARRAVTISADGGRELAPDLYDGLQRDPEVLVGTSHGRVTWRQPIDEVFPMPGASTDQGWNFDQIRREGLVVGSVRGRALRSSSKRVVIDLARSATVGLDATDGSVRWRDEGSFYLCNVVPCPGGSDPSRSTTSDATKAGPLVGVRVRASGRVTVRFRTERSVRRSPDVRVALEGFDLANGRTLWSVDLARTADVALQSAAPVGAHHDVVLRDAEGDAVLVDLETGRTSPVRSQTRVACQRDTSYRVALAYRTARGSTHHYSGQPALFSCAADGHRISGAPPNAARVALGGGELSVWTDVTGVYAAGVSTDGVQGDGGGDSGESGVKALVLGRAL